jgi:UDP-N-acetylmuramate dehydrogenase
MISEAIREKVPLAPFTTLRIGGPARYFASAKNENELFAALEFAGTRAMPVFILGGGSNILVADEGFPGLVLQVAIKGIEWLDDGLVTGCAGEDWDEFVRQCVERELAGIECLSGIPGLVGGTPVQNVGAYGQEVSETLTSIRGYDRSTQQIVELSNGDCRFAYRTSIFNTTERERYIVLAATFALKPQGQAAIRYADLEKIFGGASAKPAISEVREAVRSIRASKAMLLVPGDPDCHSAGSFFKNPIITTDLLERLTEAVPHYSAADGSVKVPAAWLIENAGFQKGYTRGRAGISSRHSLAIVNRGGATAREVLDLANEIQDRVEMKFGVRLQLEPVLIGFEMWP